MLLAFSWTHWEAHCACSPDPLAGFKRWEKVGGGKGNVDGEWYRIGGQCV